MTSGSIILSTTISRPLKRSLWPPSQILVLDSRLRLSGSDHKTQTCSSSTQISCFIQHRNFSSLRFSRNNPRKSTDKFVVHCLPPPPTGGDPSSYLKSWIVGIVISLVLPFFTHKWGPLLQIKNKVDAAVETVEHLVEAVETVAEKVEKVAEDIAEELPAGGKLRNAVDFVEHIAEDIAEDAHVVGDLIDKVQEVEEKVEDFVEAAVEGSKAEAAEIEAKKRKLE